MRKGIFWCKKSNTTSPELIIVLTACDISECKKWNMAVNYKKLWKLLMDKDLKKKDFPEKAHISSYTLNNMTEKMGYSE